MHVDCFLPAVSCAPQLFVTLRSHAARDGAGAARPARGHAVGRSPPPAAKSPYVPRRPPVRPAEATAPPPSSLFWQGVQDLLDFLFRKHSMKTGNSSTVMLLQSYRVLLPILALIILYRTVKLYIQHGPSTIAKEVYYLPRNIVESKFDTRPRWMGNASKSKDGHQSNQNLLAIATGINQKRNVDLIAQKFIAENFMIILFHYDGNVNGWDDLPWSRKAIHVVAQNQTKWWFAKRFLHPYVVSGYDYIFLWDEDLGVENFNPKRYLNIVRKEGLEISQPALDPDLSLEIHHRITIRRSNQMLHRRIISKRGGCSKNSLEPPCTGWVEGMAPVFSRSAWVCVWHLIQNDLIHGWGLDMKLGYCTKGNPRRTVGVIDTEFIVHHGIPTLGGSSRQKVQPPKQKVQRSQQKVGSKAMDSRIESRRRAKIELQIFQKRWEVAVKKDKEWVNPFAAEGRMKNSRNHLRPPVAG